MCACTCVQETDTQEHKTMNEELSINFMRVWVSNVFEFLNAQQKLGEEGKKFRTLQLSTLLLTMKWQYSLNISTNSTLCIVTTP